MIFSPITFTIFQRRNLAGTWHTIAMHWSVQTVATASHFPSRTSVRTMKSIIITMPCATICCHPMPMIGACLVVSYMTYPRRLMTGGILPPWWRPVLIPPSAAAEKRSSKNLLQTWRNWGEMFSDRMCIPHLVGLVVNRICHPGGHF